MTQPTTVRCCDVVPLRWEYSDPASWSSRDQVKIELYKYHFFKSNVLLKVLEYNLPCKIDSLPGYDWKVPAHLPSFWTNHFDSDTKCVIQVTKVGDDDVNNVPGKTSVWKPFKFEQCPYPKGQCPTSAPTPRPPTPHPTPHPTPWPTPPPPGTTTSSAMSPSSSTSSATNNAHTSTTTHTLPHAPNNTHTSYTTASMSAPYTCINATSCSACQRNASCYWCATGAGACAELGENGGWFGPFDPATHFNANLFGGDGVTCTAWRYGQCFMNGSTFLFLSLALILLPFCCSCCVCLICCLCRKRDKNQSQTRRQRRRKDDVVPLLTPGDDDDDDEASQAFY